MLFRCLNYLVEFIKGKIMIGDVKVDVEKVIKKDIINLRKYIFMVF